MRHLEKIKQERLKRLDDLIAMGIGKDYKSFTAQDVVDAMGLPMCGAQELLLWLSDNGHIKKGAINGSVTYSLKGKNWLLESWRTFANSELDYQSDRLEAL